SIPAAHLAARRRTGLADRRLKPDAPVQPRLHAATSIAVQFRYAGCLSRGVRIASVCAAANVQRREGVTYRRVAMAERGSTRYASGGLVARVARIVRVKDV